MGQPAEKRRPATYADLEAVPPGKIAQIIDGTLRVHPRPASPHVITSSALGVELGSPFQRGRGGPGGFWILDAPELHFSNPASPSGLEVVVPDLVGWRRERMPQVPRAAYFTLAPDWICEVLSPSTEAEDREEKMPLYAREGVRRAWLVDPVVRRVEVYVLGEGGRWGAAMVFEGRGCVRAVPFDTIELDLSALWVE